MRPVIQLFGAFQGAIAQSFERALENPQSAQTALQRELFARLQQSDYGQHLGIRAIADWPKIPLVNYEDIQQWLDNLSEPILFYEQTSGSRSAAKRIPYTRSLRRSFQRMFYLWARDLIQHCSLTTGQIYFCISPKLGEREEIADDSQYLQPLLRWILKPFLVTVPHLESIRDPQVFKEQLALSLLQAERLEIISIWSPTFLQVHLDYIQDNRQTLLARLTGKISPARAQLLLNPIIPWTQLWPHLKLISCWDSAAAREPANVLRSQFSGVLIQGKGLLATEAPLTIPLIAANGCVPLINEVYFEFEDERNQICTIEEIELHRTYQAIVSQKGGLYRYRLGDCVRATHYYRNTPCLEFLGRTGATSDLVGEKLTEDFASDAIAKLALKNATFKTLIPATKPHPHYILLLDRADSSPQHLAQHLDRLLSQAYHYRQARLIGQLAPVTVRISPQLPQQLLNAQIQLGQKWGDIKPALFLTHPGLAERLD